jgi:hypothetical protein
LLFVLAAELFQFVINDACSTGHLTRPIQTHDQDFPVIQYADDTLLVMQADPQQLNFLKQLLQDFATSAGLKVNFNKSLMIPINVPEDKMSSLAAGFGCQIGSMPLTYLGLPMGTTKPRFQDLTPMMDTIERKLTACSSLLSYIGRLQMVNSVLTPLATYTMCSIKLHVGVIDNIDRAIKQCLWRGNDQTKKGGNLAAWLMVHKPKKGGLGVLNLRLHNDALLLKQLNKFYAKSDVPWVQIIWSKYYQSKVHMAPERLDPFGGRMF